MDSEVTPIPSGVSIITSEPVGWYVADEHEEASGTKANLLTNQHAEVLFTAGFNEVWPTGGTSNLSSLTLVIDYPDDLQSQYYLDGQTYTQGALPTAQSIAMGLLVAIDRSLKRYPNEGNL